MGSQDSTHQSERDSSAPWGSRDSSSPASQMNRRCIPWGQGSLYQLERHEAKETGAHESGHSVRPAPAPVNPEHLPEGRVVIRKSRCARHPPFTRWRYSEPGCVLSVRPHDLDPALEPPKNEMRITPWRKNHINARPRAATARWPPGCEQTPRRPNQWAQELRRQPVELRCRSLLSKSSVAGARESAPVSMQLGEALGCTLGQHR